MPRDWHDPMSHYPWMPAKFAGTRGAFQKDPVAIVIHSGAKGRGVAEWFRSKFNRRPYWTMFAWSSRLSGFAQCDGLRQTTGHVGHWWNDHSIGIELPGPWRQDPRSRWQKESLLALIATLVEVYPSIKLITGHEFISPKKRDPGPGVDATWFSDTGLIAVWEPIDWRRAAELCR